MDVLGVIIVLSMLVVNEYCKIDDDRWSDYTKESKACVTHSLLLSLLLVVLTVQRTITEDHENLEGLKARII